MLNKKVLKLSMNSKDSSGSASYFIYFLPIFSVYKVHQITWPSMALTYFNLFPFGSPSMDPDPCSGANPLALKKIYKRRGP